MDAPNPLDSSNSKRLLTAKSIFFGGLGVFIMSGLAGFHDDVLGGTLMIGNHMPGGAFAYFMCVGLFWNGLWQLLDRAFTTGGGLAQKFALNARELAVVMAVTLVACFPPTEGLFTYFFRVIMLPWYYVQTHPQWEAHGLLTEYLPKHLFPDPWPGGGTGAAGYDIVYRGYFTGLADGFKTVPLWKLPLKAWLWPVLSWGPLIVTGSLAIIALQFIVHKQWSQNEQLSFPVARVAESFCLTKDGGRGVPVVFADRLFWCGFAPVALFLSVQCLSAWYPQSVPNLNELFPDFKSWRLPVTTYLPILKKVPDTWGLHGQALSFTIIGLTYFVSLEIGLTMGLTSILTGVAGAVFLLATGLQMDHSYTSSSRFGAGVGYTLMLAYTGRTYYAAVLAKALGMRRKNAPGSGADGAAGAAGGGANGGGAAGGDDAAGDASVVAARVFLLASLAFYIIISWMCDSWVMALFYCMITTVMFLVLSRVVCESGIPFIQPGWLIGDMLVKFFGPAAIGPRPLTFLLWGTGVIAQDPRECLMPYVATGVKVADDAGANLRKLFWVICAAVVAALVLSFLVTFHTNYNFSPMSKDWASKVPPVMHFDAAAKHFSAMKSSGVFDESLAASPLRRLLLSRAVPIEMQFFVAGLVAVLGLSLLRFRFSRFPIHPILFIAAGTYPAMITWGSFIVGWFVKLLVVRFGGGRAYQRLKPLFIGLIAGELFMVGIGVFIDFAYYCLHNTRPPVNMMMIPW